MGGDEDISLIHYKKHYRIDYPMIPDNMDQRRFIIHTGGINNMAVFGGDGVCIYNAPGMHPNLKDFQKLVDGALKKIKGSNRKKAAYVECGTMYAPDVKKEDGKIVHERMPQLAAGPDGAMYLVYCSDKSGSNDVYMRIGNKGKWGKDIPVADGKADEYAPTVASSDEGEAVVAYVGGGGKKRYDIYTVTVKNGKASKPKQLTKSKDDAMAPFMCSGDGGELWLVWYEWAKMGDISRDREIFISRSKGSGWSKPAQVSPKDVPTYEDHGEPVVFSDGKGGAWVAWAWDYHGTLGSQPPVDENSIFVRHVDKKMKMGDILAAGFRGEGRARDYVPTITVSADGTPWVAWDNSHKSSAGRGAKAIFVNRLTSEDFGEQEEAVAHRGSIDSPRLIRGPEGKLCLVWGQQTAKGWELWRRDMGPDGMGDMEEIEVRCENPRYPSACFDEKGKLWVAYSDTDSKKWRVRVEKAD